LKKVLSQNKDVPILSMILNGYSGSVKVNRTAVNFNIRL